MRLSRQHAFVGGLACLVAALCAGIAFIAFPTTSNVELPAPLESVQAAAPEGEFAADFKLLRDAFRAQRFRSFCGPASIETILRAYGKPLEQTRIFPSIAQKAETFFTGMSLAELSSLGKEVGLVTERVHADELTVDTFRERVKSNLSREGDFVLVNYDRRVLNQEGAGHISPVGAYDATTDRFLVLDEAAYKYPFTWVPTSLLYEAVHTQAGEGWRGVLFIHAYSGNQANLSHR